MEINKKIKDAIGTAIIRYILRQNTEGWLVTRKSGSQQIIKVFSRQAYENVIRPVIYKDAKQLFERCEKPRKEKTEWN